MIKQIFNRFKLPSPQFWKKMGNNCLIIGAVIAAIGSGLVVYFTVFGSIVITIGTTIGVVGKILSTMTVEDTKQLPK